MKNKVLAGTTCTTRQAADALGVAMRTAQLWAESGRLKAWKTEGGHRRILVSSVQQLLQARELADPEAPSGSPPSSVAPKVIVGDSAGIDVSGAEVEVTPSPNGEWMLMLKLRLKPS